MPNALRGRMQPAPRRLALYFLYLYPHELEQSSRGHTLAHHGGPIQTRTAPRPAHRTRRPAPRAFPLTGPPPPTPLLQNAIEIFLRLSPSFLDSRNEVLLVRMTEVTRNIGIVQGLQRLKGC